MVGLESVEEPGDVGENESADLFAITAELHRLNKKVSYTTGC
jgi:hypothetical protein